jgi:hypothetical protein
VAAGGLAIWQNAKRMRFSAYTSVTSHDIISSSDELPFAKLRSPEETPAFSQIPQSIASYQRMPSMFDKRLSATLQVFARLEASILRLYCCSDQPGNECNAVRQTAMN